MNKKQPMRKRDVLASLAQVIQDPAANPEQRLRAAKQYQEMAYPHPKRPVGRPRKYPPPVPQETAPVPVQQEATEGVVLQALPNKLVVSRKTDPPWLAEVLQIETERYWEAQRTKLESKGGER